MKSALQEVLPPGSCVSPVWNRDARVERHARLHAPGSSILQPGGQPSVRQSQLQAIGAATGAGRGSYATTPTPHMRPRCASSSSSSDKHRQTDSISISSSSSSSRINAGMNDLSAAASAAPSCRRPPRAARSPRARSPRARSPRARSPRARFARVRSARAPAAVRVVGRLSSLCVAARVAALTAAFPPVAFGGRAACAARHCASTHERHLR